MTDRDFGAEKRVEFVKKDRQPVEIAHSIKTEKILPGVVYVFLRHGRIRIAPTAELISVKAAAITRATAVEKCVYVITS